MKKSKFSLYTLLLVSTLLINCTNRASESENTWTPLFDGESFTGWKMYGSDTDSISSKWEIEGGMIIASREGDGPGINTGFDESLMTIEQFDNFELELEFRNSEGGNSGIMYHVIEDSTSAMDYFTGHEYQILDDYHFADQVREFQYTASVLPSTLPDQKLYIRPENGIKFELKLIMEKQNIG